VQRRITSAVWERSRPRQWDDIEIREPAPVDMALVALVLQRCWGAERWHLKPHDVIDFRYIESAGVTRDALRERARALGCERTLALFLERCDPTAGRLDLSPPSRHARLRFDRLAFRERGLLGRRERTVARIVAAPVSVSVGLTFVPLVLRIRRALRGQPDIRSILERLAMTADTPLDRRRTRAMVVPGVSWALRLVGAGSAGPCVVRALAVFTALRQRGWPVDFVSGVRRNGSSVVGHAWVEDHRGALLDLEQADVHGKYSENFRFSSRVRAAVSHGPESSVTTRAPSGASGPVVRTPRD
jgi:hypothetical protein